MSQRFIRRLAAGALLVLAALFLVPTAPASAKPAELWGFAYNDNPNPVGEYVMPKERQWGSWKDVYPSDWATVAQLSAGLYRVTFPRIGGKGLAHVTAVSRGPISCQIAQTTPSFEVELVYIRCYKPGGSPADSAFSVAYSESRSTDGLYGWVRGAADGTVLNSYNSTGGINAVGGDGLGTYKVWMPGMSSTTAMGDIQVTAVNPYRPARCKVVGWSPGSTGQVIVITCQDALGARMVTDWNLTFHHKANLFGAGDPPRLWGYLWDTLGVVTPPAATNVNSIGSINTVTSVGSNRVVVFNKIGFDPSHVQVTASGSYADFCNLTGAWDIPGPYTAATVTVACYTAAGLPTRGESFVDYTSAR